MNFQTIKKNFDKGLWNESMVKMAVRKGVISQAECDVILTGTTEIATVEDYVNALNELGVTVNE